jgi:hypothetical protein
MAPWFVNILRDLSGVTLGWILGFASSAIRDWLKEKWKCADTQRAISAELYEVTYRLLLILYSIESAFGKFDRKLLEWMLPLIQKYEGPNPKEGISAGITGLLKNSDTEIAHFAAVQRAKTSSSYFYPRIEASYTASALSHAHDFDPDYALRVLDILSHIQMFNDTRDSYVFYEHLTFTPGLTPENYRNAVKNAEEARLHLSQRARIIVDKFNALEQKYTSRKCKKKPQLTVLPST